MKTACSRVFLVVALVALALALTSCRGGIAPGKSEPLNITGTAPISGGVTTQGATPEVSGEQGAEAVPEALAKPYVFIDPPPGKVEKFGVSVSASGERAIVGMPGVQDESLGKAYILNATIGSEGILQELSPAAVALNDRFGFSVAINGDDALVGAPSTLVNGIFAGTVYAFHFENNKWVEKKPLALPVPIPAGGDQFGSSLALSGDYAIVGAPGKAVNNVLGAGAAFIFHKESGEWVLKQEFYDPVPKNMDSFGFSVAISNDKAIVGVPYGDTVVQGDQAGCAYTLRIGNNGWELMQGKLVASIYAISEHFGSSVAMDGDEILIGATLLAVKNVEHAGQVFAFHFDGNKWNQTQAIAMASPKKDYFFGQSIAIKGTKAIVGNALSGVPETSAVFNMIRDATGWQFSAPGLVTPAGEVQAGDGFGLSVGIGDDFYIVGAPSTSKVGPAMGRVYIMR